MPEVVQNVLYLTTPGLYLTRDHLTLRIEHEHQLKLALPIHHVESVCVFGPEVLLSPGALHLCHAHGVAVNYLSSDGYFEAQLRGIPDTSVVLRRAHFRAADNPALCLLVARRFLAGKLQNARISLLRGAREATLDEATAILNTAADKLARLIHSLPDQSTLDALRGAEGASAQAYFAAFASLLKQQRDYFTFTVRTRQPPRDRINCLLSFLYALLRHDCSAALTCIGLDPFVGFLHAERPNRPALALDLMEEFRPWLADRLAVTLINRQQIAPNHFREREGGAVEFTEAGRKLVIKAWQERKQQSLTHPILGQDLKVGQMPFVQARILARVLRGDASDYLPLVPK
jgi:CRISPR-associated protein Cas1